MKLENFFREHRTVIWSSEYLKNMMTSAIPGLEREYRLGEAKIAESSAVFNREMLIVVVEMTLLSDETHHDYLVYVPETNDIKLWYGELTHRMIIPHEIGRRFEVLLQNGDRVQGKIAMNKGQLCFQFKPDYYGEESNG